MLESIIKDKIIVHFDTDHLFYEQQHGFHPMMSRITQLLHAMEHWTKSLDNGNDVDIVYLDFCKAFYGVPHQRILSKLKDYDISGNAIIGLWTFYQTDDRKLMLMVHVLIDAML